MTKHVEKPWSDLSRTLAGRRNLECALTPSADIGSMDTPRQLETHTAFIRRISESRKRHDAYRADVFSRFGVKTTEQARSKVEELKSDEVCLWRQCRPDLYA